MKAFNHFNILTRTSNRPSGFRRCYNSIKNQNYPNVTHYVSSDNERDLDYLSKYEDIIVHPVIKKQSLNSQNEEELIFSPYNLYCNELLELIDDGWVLFLDDDDFLIYNGVLNFLNSQVSNADKSQMFIFQMRYPNGNVKPESIFFKNENIKKDHIGSPCFLVHSSVAKKVKWDQWKAADFRYIKGLENMVSDIKWIERPLIEIGNYGDWGSKNDYGQTDRFLHKFGRSKYLWELIPKKHQKILNVKIFYFKNLRERIPNLWKRIKRQFFN